MLRVVGIVVKDNEIIGYQLFDGSSKFMVTVMQLWKTAQKQQIDNVDVNGTEENPVIKSKVGFDLKDLPQVEYEMI